MIGLDTNILVRYLAQDDPAQGEAAAKLIDSELAPTHPGFIGLVVLVELCWVLKRLYGATPEEMLATVADMLQLPQLCFERADTVQRTVDALQAGRHPRAGLPDALISRIALDEGCHHTLTFDRAAARWPGMKLLAAEATLQGASRATSKATPKAASKVAPKST